MRGKPRHALEKIAPTRNIPAYAGKTAMRAWGLVGLCGTSPRMRGKLYQYGKEHDSDRNIPAYAGKTDTNQSRNTGGAEHPRVCGENAGGT